MIKHTLEIAQRGAKLSLRRKQLAISFSLDDERRFACEDVGVLVLQHPAIEISSAVINSLLEAGCVVVFCNEKHMPSGVLLPTLHHSELIPRLTAQMGAGLPARKRVWKELVRAKILAQAKVIEDPGRTRLLHLASEVKSGDPDNREAVAAKVYWSAVFPEIYAAGDQRDSRGVSRFNGLLNYGYAILRAAVARAVVSAGMQPALGLYHHRKDNPFCLADDVMEPLRPFVDSAVQRRLNETSESDELSSEDRQEMLSILAMPVQFGDTKGPVMAVLPRYVNSVYRMLIGEDSSLTVPTV